MGPILSCQKIKLEAKKFTTLFNRMDEQTEIMSLIVTCLLTMRSFLAYYSFCLILRRNLKLFLEPDISGAFPLSA